MANKVVGERFLPAYCNVVQSVNRDFINSCICSHSKKCSVCTVSSMTKDAVIDRISVHEQVISSGKHNFEGCKIPVNHHVDTGFMRRMLGAEYNDLLVCDLLKYGFPIGYKDKGIVFEAKPVWKYKNHSGANLYPQEINEYLRKECESECVVGPFKKNPFSSELKVSPLNSVPKKGTTERRVILDLSMPAGAAVNDCVDKDEYLGERVNLVFPRVDDFVKLVKAKGPGCLMFKKDLRKAYRQISICPGDYHLVAFCWQKHIFCDTVLSMGLRSAAAICQRVTTAVCYMMLVIGVCVLNYLDDLAGVETRDRAGFAYECLGQVLRKSGLKESVDKAAAPSEIMTFLGVQFNSITMTVEVTPERLVEIGQLVKVWLQKREASLRELQSLVGKLNFVAACVRAGRVFISRLLKWLKELYGRSPHACVRIPDFVKKDLEWWNRFLCKYNGISVMYDDKWSRPDGIFQSDACLQGCGGYCEGKFFHIEFPDYVLDKKYSIASLEFLSIILCLKLWGSRFKGKKVLVYCDNEAVCHVLNTGKARCEVLQECLRESCFVSAMSQCELKAVHLSSSQNRLADCLSRWALDKRCQQEFFDLTCGVELEEYSIADSDFEFVNNW